MARLSPARRLAVDVLLEVDRRDAFAASVLDARLDRGARLSGADAAFSRVLVMGVVACRGVLDEFLDRCLRSPHDVRANVRCALRVPVYELLFLGKPAHVAVDQGVELVRAVEPKAAGLANAVLRKAVRLKASFPFGDPSADDAALARSEGFPSWMAKALIAQMGRPAAASFMRASNTPAPLFLAANAAVSSGADEELSRALSSDGVASSPVELAGVGRVPGCLRASDGRAVHGPHTARLLEQGRALVSDASAQAVATLALPERMPDLGVLEVGAGRGTKTVLLASDAVRAFGGQPPIVAVDDQEFKVDLLTHRARACGVRLEKAVCADGRRLDQALGDRVFSAVLVDAPCSGLGTLRRHPEIRWRLTPADVDAMAGLGSQLLFEAARRTAVGGRLTFSTCTVTHQEDADVVEAFLTSEAGKGFRLVRVGAGDDPFFAPRLAEGGPDAHFAACMERVA